MVEDEAEAGAGAQAPCSTNAVAKLAASEREGAAAACYAVAALCLENSHNQARLGKIHGLCESVAMAMVTLLPFSFSTSAFMASLYLVPSWNM